MSLLGAGVLSLAQGSLRQARKNTEMEQAFYLANAGMEAVLAKAVGGESLAAGASLQRSMSVGPSLQGTYNVQLAATETNGVLRVSSEGVMGQSRRSITATLSQTQEYPLTYEHLVYSTGAVSVDNHTDICGDLYAAGDVTVSAQSTLWGKTTAQDPASPCREVFGTGKVISAGRITFNGQAIAQGNWCDATRYGPGYACSSPPAKLSMSVPTSASLKSRATRLYVRDATLCVGRPPGTCTVVPAGYTLTLTGASTYGTDLIFVDGNVTVGTAGWFPTGLVTVAATGSVQFLGRTQTNPIACAKPDSCAVAFISEGPQTVDRSVFVSGTFITSNTAVGFTWGNSAEIRGVVLAPKVASGNHGTFYPLRQSEVWLPPGVPAPSTASSGTRFQNWSE